MNLRLGNLSPTQFAEHVGTEFTNDEAAYLQSVWSQNAALTGPDDFHIFSDPAISITVGSASSRTLEVFKAANSRTQFNREITFDLDEQYQKEQS
jgi:hypothetical protein